MLMGNFRSLVALYGSLSLCFRQGAPFSIDYPIYSRSHSLLPSSLAHLQSIWLILINGKINPGRMCYWAYGTWMPLEVFRDQVSIY